MAVSKDIRTAVAEYNENTRWARIYCNTDNGYTWFEDDLTCPKANHITYNNNPNIKVVCEKGSQEDKTSEVTTVTAEEVAEKIAAL